MHPQLRWNVRRLLLLSQMRENHGIRTVFKVLWVNKLRLNFAIVDRGRRFVFADPG